MRKPKALTVEAVKNFLITNGYSLYVPLKEVLYRLNLDWLIEVSGSNSFETMTFDLIVDHSMIILSV